ncbi:MAG: Cof-type HAD-IIB family hydrolase [Thaumarchaeota archaeon]|nr:Cof-type HAD-IIB family hydrolase [Nitrososphaerota archaeon]
MPKSIRNILIFDYDGTLTLNDVVIPEVTKRCLHLIKQSDLATLGIISGRDLKFLDDVNQSLSNVFSFLIAENGAISYFLDTREKTVLGSDWSKRAKEVFSNSGIPLHFAEVMFATRIQYAQEISELLGKYVLDAKMVPNKDSLMILPPNVDKGTGVAATVQHFGSTRKLFLTCFGDGENDIALFAAADLRVAVANAVDALKMIADVVTEEPGGLGVAEYLNETFLLEETAKD